MATTPTETAHARRLVDSVYHRLMSCVTNPGLIRYVNVPHNHTDIDDNSICMWCAVHQPAETPHLDTVILEAICDTACVALDGTATNPYIIEAKLASASQRGAIASILGDNWAIYLPAAYRITDMTAAEVAREAATLPATITPSHSARLLGNQLSAHLLGLPSGLSSRPEAKSMAHTTARLIEARAWPFISHPPRATTTRAELLGNAHTIAASVPLRRVTARSAQALRSAQQATHGRARAATTPVAAGVSTPTPTPAPKTKPAAAAVAAVSAPAPAAATGTPSYGSSLTNLAELDATLASLNPAAAHTLLTSYTQNVSSTLTITLALLRNLTYNYSELTTASQHAKRLTAAYANLNHTLNQLT